MSRKQYYLVIIVVIIIFWILFLAATLYYINNNASKADSAVERLAPQVDRLSEVLCDPIVEGRGLIGPFFPVATPDGIRYCQQVS